MTWWQWIGIASAALALVVAMGLVVGRIIRAGTSHLGDPLSDGWRPGGGDYI